MTNQRSFVRVRSACLKIAAFQRLCGAKETLLLTLITAFGVRKDMYSGIVQSQVVLDDLFETL